ncbi:hypothetical protein AAP_00332 [Ascosphaera apis ARSEF 7405]|uniref:Uncharacterized protein n=1 Tax=Ascosphaera apis ARSEF 7405 TaxID=392613 RepID=A0A168DST6_9EURO|nr:hypothetical protein AAP_00332 [Ascosphaera apis ARSEF 7405]
MTTTWGSREGADENDKDRMREKVEAADISIQEKVRMLEDLEMDADDLVKKHHSVSFLQKPLGIMNPSQTCQLA